MPKNLIFSFILSSGALITSFLTFKTYLSELTTPKQDKCQVKKDFEEFSAWLKELKEKGKIEKTNNESNKIQIEIIEKLKSYDTEECPNKSNHLFEKMEEFLQTNTELDNYLFPQDDYPY